MLKSRECIIPKMNPNVNCGLYLVVIYQYWLINYDQHTMQILDVNNNGNHMGKRDYTGILYFPLKFSIKIKLL